MGAGTPELLPRPSSAQGSLGLGAWLAPARWLRARGAAPPARACAAIRSFRTCRAPLRGAGRPGGARLFPGRGAGPAAAAQLQRCRGRQQQAWRADARQLPTLPSVLPQHCGARRRWRARAAAVYARGRLGRGRGTWHRAVSPCVSRAGCGRPRVCRRGVWRAGLGRGVQHGHRRALDRITLPGPL